MTADKGRQAGRAGWALVLAVLIFAASIAYVFYDRDQQRSERSKVFCAYVYQQLTYQRADALKGYRDLPKYARFFNDPVGDLQKVARANLIRDFESGRYSYKRLPAYCPQHDYPAAPPNL